MSECSPFLWMRSTLAIFSKSGYSPVEIDRLNSLARGFAIREAEFFKNLAGISSKPVSFFVLTFSIWYLTSYSLVSRRQNDFNTGLFRNSLKLFLLWYSKLLAKLFPILVKNLLISSVTILGSVMILLFILILLIFTLLLLFFSIFPKVFHRFWLLLLCSIRRER